MLKKLFVCKVLNKKSRVPCGGGGEALKVVGT